MNLAQVVRCYLSLWNEGCHENIKLSESSRSARPNDSKKLNVVLGGPTSKATPHSTLLKKWVI
jgi:hypothetical protein